MEKSFYELQIIPSHFIDIFSDFIMDLGVEAIELKEKAIIVRSKDDTSEIEWGVQEFAKNISKITETEIEVKTVKSIKKDEDWIEKYKNSITPIEVGKFYIHPSWMPEKKDKIDILIDPALSFGTGHHETTSSCLEILGDIVKKNDEFLDVGCGSGILSIAASKLGAIVDLCDSDSLSVESAKKNFKLNGVRYRDIWVGSANDTLKKYDVVVANIVADVLVMINRDLKKRLEPDATLILSGILDKYLDKVLESFKELKTVNIIKKGEWRTLHLKKG